MSRNKYIIFILSIFILTSCQKKYESKKYIEEENKAILDLIPQMTDMDRKLEMNADYSS